MQDIFNQLAGYFDPNNQFKPEQRKEAKEQPPASQPLNLMEDAEDLQKNQFVFSVRKDGNVGYISTNDGRFITEGFIGECEYNTWQDLIKGLQGLDIAIDNFYW